MAEIHVTGLRDLQGFLDMLPAKLERNVMRGALRAGVKPIKAAAVANCPVGEPNAEGAKLYGLYRGALRDSIRISTRAKGHVVTATVKAGGKTKSGADVFYAHFIEGFWKHHKSSPYLIAAFKKAGRLSFGGIFRKTVMHPPLVAHPFLRPALDGQAKNAIVAAAEYMKKRLATKEGLDTSDIVIEAES